MANCRGALTRSLAVLGALTAMVLTGSLAAQEVVPAPSDGPTVLPGAPEILRGSVASPPPAIELAAGSPKAGSPKAGSSEPLIAGGDRIWFVDRESRRLTGCRLINTIYVDTQAIRCTERRLPRGAIVRD